MTHDDPLLQRLSQLTELSPDRRRAERVRAQCRARLAPRAPERRRSFGPAVFAGLGLLYLSAIVHDVLQLRGFL